MIEYKENLKCLLICAKFNEYNYWNFDKYCSIIGAKALTPPLGLLTVAAILPQTWQFKLLDLNAYEWDEDLWEWADIICIGGMIPQQKPMLDIIAKANQEKKFIVVGGVDPTSQPQIYNQANSLVLNEGEITIPLWLESWIKYNKPDGIFSNDCKVDLSNTPVPRFDLIKLDDYYEIGIQYSRGCPFNCEFCDIIELFGRKPRTKSFEQLKTELDFLYNLGYRGQVDFVDDNFIGNLKKIKEDILPKLIEWQKTNNYPFWFAAQASINLGDDLCVLKQMYEAGFRSVFIGIETVDEQALYATNKKINIQKPFLDRIYNIYQHGMLIYGGFIIGFDEERSGVDKKIIELIDKASITLAMVGLLVALPNTQLSKRLQKENRLLNFQLFKVDELNSTESIAKIYESLENMVDQTIAGLNFITKRSRLEIIQEFENIITTIYLPQNYFRRCYEAAKKLVLNINTFKNTKPLKHTIKALFKLFSLISKQNFSTQYYFWKYFIKSIFLGPFKLEIAVTLMGAYLHLSNQTNFIIRNLQQQIQIYKEKNLI